MNNNNLGERADVATSDPCLSSGSEEGADARVRQSHQSGYDWIQSTVIMCRASGSCIIKGRQQDKGCVED